MRLIILYIGVLAVQLAGYEFTGGNLIVGGIMGIYASVYDLLELLNEIKV